MRACGPAGAKTLWPDPKRVCRGYPYACMGRSAAYPRMKDYVPDAPPPPSRPFYCFISIIAMSTTHAGMAAAAHVEIFCCAAAPRPFAVWRHTVPSALLNLRLPECCVSTLRACVCVRVRTERVLCDECDPACTCTCTRTRKVAIHSHSLYGGIQCMRPPGRLSHIVSYNIVWPYTVTRC